MEATCLSCSKAVVRTIAKQVNVYSVYILEWKLRIAVSAVNASQLGRFHAGGTVRSCPHEYLGT